MQGIREKNSIFLKIGVEIKKISAILMEQFPQGVMVERLRQRSAKPVPVGSTPTHASIFVFSFDCFFLYSLFLRIGTNV